MENIILTIQIISKILENLFFNPEGAFIVSLFTIGAIIWCVIFKYKHNY